MHDQRTPTREELIHYGKWLGIQYDDDLSDVLANGLRSSLPPGWESCFNKDGKPYYFNTLTGVSKWAHPNDINCKQEYLLKKGLKRTALSCITNTDDRRLPATPAGQPQGVFQRDWSAIRCSSSPSLSEIRSLRESTESIMSNVTVSPSVAIINTPTVMSVVKMKEERSPSLVRFEHTAPIELETPSDSQCQPAAGDMELSAVVVAPSLDPIQSVCESPSPSQAAISPSWVSHYSSDEERQPPPCTPPGSGSGLQTGSVSPPSWAHFNLVVTSPSCGAERNSTLHQSNDSMVLSLDKKEPASKTSVVEAETQTPARECCGCIASRVVPAEEQMRKLIIDKYTNRMSRLVRKKNRHLEYITKSLRATHKQVTRRSEVLTRRFKLGVEPVSELLEQQSVISRQKIDVLKTKLSLQHINSFHKINEPCPSTIA